jgi:HAD superfamily hydrolase (TIGR01509 family)
MLSWGDIDTIMFDMDGTLLDLHFDSYFWHNLIPQAYSEKHNISVEVAQDKILAGYEKVYGLLDWYCLDHWTEELGLDIKELKKTITHKIAIRPNVLILLKELQLLQKRIILITNAHPISLNIKMKHTGLEVFFHQCISSHSLELAKENPGFWEKLQSLEPYKPDRTVLFDDSLPVLQQAKREGIKYLFGIAQPDSKNSPIELEDFPQIEDFNQILPSSLNAKEITNG